MKNSYNHYKLIQLIPQKNYFKVHNFKKDQIEVYNLSLKKKPFKKKSISFNTSSKSLKKTLLDNPYKSNKITFKILSSLYKKYKNYAFLARNDFFFKYVFLKFLKNHNKTLIKKKTLLQQFYNFQTNNAVKKNVSISKIPTLISVYVVLRQNNIFVTVTKNSDKILKVFSSGYFGIERSNRKRSPSFFTVVKKTLYYLKPYTRSNRQNFLFRLVFKGFKRFRRPLINRFLYNKDFKSKCIGIFNLDFEPFNGCRKRKPKRIKLKRKN